MKLAFLRLRSLAWRLLLAVILLAGLSNLAGRLLVPRVADYRAEIERLVSDSSGQQVTIGRVEGVWRGLGPELRLHDLALIDPQRKRQQLQLNEVRVRFAVIDSLRRWALTPRSITLVRPNLRLIRHGDGSIGLAGSSEEGAGELNTENESDPGFLLAPSRLRILDGALTLVDQVHAAPPLRLQNVDIRLRNDQQRHQLSGTISLAEAPQSAIRLEADLRSEQQAPLSWSGALYLAGKSLDYRLLRKLRLPWKLTGGNADFQLWGELERGRLQQISGDLAIAGLEFNGKVANRIDRFSSRLSWQRQAKGWQLDASDLTLQKDAHNWPATRFSLKVQQEEGSRKLALGLDFLDLGDLLPLVLDSGLVPDKALKPLRGMAPDTEFYGLRMRFSESGDDRRWSLLGEARNLSVQAWKEVPGVDNLTGRFWLDQDQGSLRLSGEQTTADIRQLFRQPLKLEQFNASLQWKRLPQGGWELTSQQPIIAGNADLQTRTRLRIELPDNGPVFTDLQTDYRDGDARNAGRYYPTTIMPEGVVEWLDRSIISGRVVDGSFLLYGPLSDFPFDKTPSGRFEVLFRTEDLLLDYQPGWPKLVGVEAEVRFLNNRFDAWLSRGRIYDSRVTRAHGYIDELDRTSPFTLDGEVEGPLADNLRLLRESPLAEEFAPLTQGVEAAGNARMKLGLAIPIDDGSRQRLDGRLQFLNSTLKLPEWGFDLKRINGALGFNLDGVQARQIKAQLDDGPIQVDVIQSPDNPNATRINARLDSSAEKLKGRFPALARLPLEGRGSWQLELDVPHLSQGDKAPVPVKLGSDLAGFNLDLPPPLGKQASEIRQLSIETRLDDIPRRPLRLRYQQGFGANLWLGRSPDSSLQLLGGTIRLGDDSLPPAREAGLAIEGRISQLELAPWIEWLGGQETGSGALPEWQSIRLQVDNLLLPGLPLKEFSINLQPADSGVSGQVQSDRLTGSLQIPADPQLQPVELNLQNLDLDFSPEQFSRSNGDNEPARSASDPERFPLLQAKIERLSINQKPFGRVEVITRRVPRGLELQTLSVNSKLLQLQATGSWRNQPDELGSPQSRLDLALESGDFGQLLETLGFTRNLDDAPANIDARIGWPGGPDAISTARINGQLRLSLGKGRFLSVDPGVGRVFGLLNLGALQRRLTLDFSDMLKKGFSFDRISGDFLLDGGDAYTENFAMTGPAASIEIVGRTGLVSEDFDQTVTVTPKISSSLPLAGAIAGGPAVGAALFLAQQLVGDTLDKVTKVRYSVTGPWDKPKVVSIRKPAQASPKQKDDLLLAPEPRQKEWQLPNTQGYNLAPELENPLPHPGFDGPGEETTVEESDSADKPGLLRRLFRAITPTGPARESTAPSE